MISLIWAMDMHGLIGDGNDLPWNIPAELQYFKETTMGHPIIMGRKTFESLGKPLPGRENIILTRNRDFTREDCQVFYSVPDLLKYIDSYGKEVFIIGGAQIYDIMLPYARRLYVTKINDTFVGDTYFPVMTLENWELISEEKGLRDEKNPYDYDHLIYERKRW